MSEFRKRLEDLLHGPIPGDRTKPTHSVAAAQVTLGQGTRTAAATTKEERVNVFPMEVAHGIGLPISVQDHLAQFLSLVLILRNLVGLLVLALDKPKFVGGTELAQVEVLPPVKGVDAEESFRFRLDLIAPVFPLRDFDDAGIWQELHPALRDFGVVREEEVAPSLDVAGTPTVFPSLLGKHLAEGILTVNEERRAVSPVEVPALLPVLCRDEHGVGPEQLPLGNGQHGVVLSISVDSSGVLVVGVLFVPVVRQLHFVIALPIHPVRPAAVVGGVRLLDQFKGPIHEHSVRHSSEPPPFGSGSLFGMVLAAFLQHGLELVIHDGADQPSLAPRRQFAPNLLPPFGGDAYSPSHGVLLSQKSQWVSRLSQRCPSVFPEKIRR